MLIKLPLKIAFFLLLLLNGCGGNSSNTAIEQTQTDRQIEQYLETVSIPAYDASNSSHVLITEINGNWSDAVLNDATKQHFYITPGSYHTLVRLTSSGTKESRRTLSLYNGNDAHPARLSSSEIADIRIWFKGASYWVLDRLSNINDANTTSFRFYVDSASSKASTHNVINRLHMSNYYYGIIISPFCDFNTVQNSYIENMTHAGILSDNVAIALANNSVVGTITRGSKFINNDIRNANDGIQLVVSSGISSADVDYPSTIIDSNNIWVDGDRYTNGDYDVSGYNSAGSFMIGENAIDLKTGASDPATPIVVTNNRMWGYLERDRTAGGSFSTGPGRAFVSHFGVNNVFFEKNIIFDSQYALSISSSYDWSVKYNIFTRINKVNPDDDATYATYFYSSDNINIENNIYYDIDTRSDGRGYFLSFINTTTNTTFSKNVIIDASGTTNSHGNRAESNFFYNVLNVRLNSTNDYIYATSAEANMGDYSFIYERFTSSPKTKTLNSVVTTTSSPHYDVVGNKMIDK